jgi:transposase
MDGLLFDPEEFRPDPACVEAEAAAKAAGRPRLRLAQRNQVEMQWFSLDELLEPGHRARIVWDAVVALDLGRWLADLKAVEGVPGRDATDPRILLAIWLYATIEGIGSGRRLDELCRKHIAYRWLCGGVSVNYHMLSDFRSQEGNRWDELLTELVASLMAEGLVTINRIAQDGMRVRANAGKGSFRRKPRLEQCLEEAREQVEELRKLLGESPEKLTAQERAARQRAAEERRARLEEALRHCDELQQQREERGQRGEEKKKKPAEARASTTDPESRVMKFADGGYRPGVNVQYATDTESGVVVGVEVTSAGNDQGHLSPMLDQLEDRYGKVPDEAVVDGGFASLEEIEDAAVNHNCRVYAPLKDEEKQVKSGKNPYARKKGDSDAVAEWRARMGTELGRAIYKLRCQTAEWVNAVCRNHGLWQMPVRGLAKCRVVAVLHAIAHNLMTAVRLRAERAASPA